MDRFATAAVATRLLGQAPGKSIGENSGEKDHGWSFLKYSKFGSVALGATGTKYLNTHLIRVLLQQPCFPELFLARLFPVLLKIVTCESLLPHLPDFHIEALGVSCNIGAKPNGTYLSRHDEISVFNQRFCLSRCD